MRETGVSFSEVWEIDWDEGLTSILKRQSDD